jgi:hypothetical protein
VAAETVRLLGREEGAAAAVGSRQEVVETVAGGWQREGEAVTS